MGRLFRGVRSVMSSTGMFVRPQRYLDLVPTAWAEFMAIATIMFLRDRWPISTKPVRIIGVCVAILAAPILIFSINSINFHPAVAALVQFMIVITCFKVGYRIMAYVFIMDHAQVQIEFLLYAVQRLQRESRNHQQGDTRQKSTGPQYFDVSSWPCSTIDGFHPATHLCCTMRRSWKALREQLGEVEPDIIVSMAVLDITWRYADDMIPHDGLRHWGHGDATWRRSAMWSMMAFLYGVSVEHLHHDDYTSHAVQDLNTMVIASCASMVCEGKLSEEALDFAMSIDPT